MLWIGGDGHAAGAYAVNHCATCEDDADLWWKGRQPHPENAAVNWATTLANTLKLQFVNEADIRDDALTIATKGRRWVGMNRHSVSIVLVGFSDPQAAELKEFSEFLKVNNTRHLFFNTGDYQNFMRENRFSVNEYGYFGKPAHQAWANVMLAQLRRLGFV